MQKKCKHDEEGKFFMDTICVKHLKHHKKACGGRYLLAWYCGLCETHFSDNIAEIRKAGGIEKDIEITPQLTY